MSIPEQHLLAGDKTQSATPKPTNTPDPAAESSSVPMTCDTTLERPSHGKHVRGRFCINPPHLPAVDPDESQLLAALADRLDVHITLGPDAIARMKALWSALVAVGADEISDWAMPAGIEISAEDGGATPRALALSCTVFADGEVYLAVNFDGLNHPLWCATGLDVAAVDPLAR